jgi:hypothetical protein
MDWDVLTSLLFPGRIDNASFSCYIFQYRENDDFAAAVME